MTPSASIRAASLPAFPAWRTFLWRHPEWWAMAISAASWIYLLSGILMPDPHRHHHHHHHTSPVWEGLWHWAAMIPAMMFPFLIGHLRLVATRSFWNRRDRAMAMFLVGYSLPWLVLGPLAVFAVIEFPVGPLWILVAAVWQVTPFKRRALLACHRTMPLAPKGIRADLSCVRFGAAHATGCLMSCWALMFACAATHAWIWSMPVFTYFQWTERAAPMGVDPRRRVAGLLLILAAGLAYFTVQL